MLEKFDGPLNSRWTQTAFGGATLETTGTSLRMGLDTVPQHKYANAQIDDYGQTKRASFPWRPPLRMEVQARSSRPVATSTSVEPQKVLQGTAGFGFWNYPFSVKGDILMLPEAVWFFYASPPSNMALVPDIPGWGWKAQVIHAMRPGTFLSALPMALSTTLALTTGETRPAARWLQRLTGAQETLLQEDTTIWHTYSLEWREGVVHFWVDGQPVLHAPHPPTRPLGFVAWLDNQFAIATPRGQLHFGTVGCEPEWLEITNLKIEPL